MNYTTYTVNQAGLVEIKEFLQANHKTFADQEPMNSELSAWAADAEFQIAEGNPAAIEIPARNSISGAPVTYTVSDAGLDARVVEIEE